MVGPGSTRLLSRSRWRDRLIVRGASDADLVYRFPVRCTHTLVQRYELPLHRRQLPRQRFDHFFVKQCQSLTEVNLALHLACRPNRNPEKPRKVSSGGSTAAFGDVRRDRHRRRSHLSCEPESLASRQERCRLVDTDGKIDAVLPDRKLPEVLHKPAPTMHRSAREPLRPGEPTPPVMRPITYHLPPNTGGTR